MNPTQILDLYFTKLNQKAGWENYIADDMMFVSPRQSSNDKEAYVTATNRFLLFVEHVQPVQQIVEGLNVCVLVKYHITSPAGKKGICEVAEILSIKDEKINSSRIYFDTAAFQKFITES